MNPAREFVALPDRCSEIIADGVVHAIGVCLGLIGAVTIVVMAVNQRGADLGLCHRPRHNACVLSCLQHVAGLARQVGSASLRPLRDLFIDRRNLHAIFGTDEKHSSLGRSRHRRLVERRRWRDAFYACC
jgi:hypothetical protein